MSSTIQTYLPQNSLSKEKNTTQLPLLITTGEPAGIGMDIVIMLAEQGKLADFNQPILVLANIKVDISLLIRLVVDFHKKVLLNM